MMNRASTPNEGEKEMQDRFKFRIYDKSILEISYRVCLGFIDDGQGTQDWVCADTTCGQINYRDDKLKNIKIMQCTGLKDKNGKLIYEGDIVKCGNFIYRVAYDDIKFASFVLIRTNELEMFKHYFGEAVDSEDVEIIGNIHENPELLTESEEE